MAGVILLYAQEGGDFTHWGRKRDVWKQITGVVDEGEGCESVTKGKDARR